MLLNWAQIQSLYYTQKKQIINKHANKKKHIPQTKKQRAKACQPQGRQAEGKEQHY